MSSLYRTWRSRSFDDLLGQDGVVRTLRNAVAQGRPAHAYLFTGPRGTGKTSTARILAKAVNCLHPVDGNPDNTCSRCVATNEGRALDVIEIDAASNTSVENVRDLRERVAYASNEGAYKVYIVDEVHRLSGAAFDAFLKTLEEPPPHVIFVFASTEPQKVPATITSRCQRFDFRRISPEVTVQRLRAVAAGEDLAVSDDALVIIAQHAGGSLRDALGLLEQTAAYATGKIGADEVRNALGLAAPELVAQLTDSLLAGNTAQSLTTCASFVEAGGDPGQLIEQMIEYWRAILLASSGAAVPTGALDPALLLRVHEQAAAVRPGMAVAVLKALSGQQFGSRYNVPAELPLEIALLEAERALTSMPTATVQAPAPRPSPVPAMPSVPTETKHNTKSLPSLEEDSANRNGVRQELEESANPPPVNGAHEASSGISAAGQIPPGDMDGAWTSVVAAMRAKSPTLQALIRSGHVLSAVNGEIVVGFLHAFHASRFSDPKMRKLLEEVVAQVMGVPYRVVCRQTSREEIEAVRGSGALRDDDGFVEEAAERLRQYHARELGNSSST